MPTQKRYYIKIETGTDDTQELADMLRQIAIQLEEGIVKGYYPTWTIETEEHNPENTMD